MFDYPVIFTPDDDSVLVTFPDVPEAITFGANEDEALRQAVDALETALSFYVNDHRPLPIPSIIDGFPTVRPSALECVKLGLYAEMLKQGVRKSELARRLHWHTPQVDHLLDLTRVSRLEQLETAFHALGKRIDVEIVDYH
jgi:antitoxin HicB